MFFFCFWFCVTCFKYFPSTSRVFCILFNSKVVQEIVVKIPSDIYLGFPQKFCIACNFCGDVCRKFYHFLKTLLQKFLSGFVQESLNKFQMHFFLGFTFRVPPVASHVFLFSRNWGGITRNSFGYTPRHWSRNSSRENIRYCFRRFFWNPSRTFQIIPSWNLQR